MTGPTPRDDLVPSLVSFGPDACADLDAGLGREWLVTNGLGGYAYGTVAGAPTRAYHGLLVAAMSPPVGRAALVGGLLETATVDGRRYDLSTLALSTGAIAPAGYRHLAGFRLDGMLPAWRYTAGGAVLERRVWMAHGRNTTYVRWTVVEASEPVVIAATVLITEREHHDAITVDLRRPVVEPDGPARVVARMTPDGIPIVIGACASDGIAATLEGRSAADPLEGGDAGRPWRPGEDPAGRWVRGIRLRVESERGLPDVTDVFAAATARAVLPRGASLDLVLSAEASGDPAPDEALSSARERQRSLVALAGAEASEPLVRHLVIAADQFVVERRPAADAAAGAAVAAGADDRTVIAGYPWFADWGRDTMIALPGLCLATGRADDAARMLRGFARYVRDGLIPNNFPDETGVVPGYHTVDASLWFVHAVAAYVRATGDEQLGDDLLPTLRAIVDAHVAGTRFGIGVDPADGLLRAGEPGYQLTWMDAKAGEWVVTPRMGKPVEIQALWHEALRDLADAMEARRDTADAATYGAMADRVRASFRARFARPRVDHLLDVVDGPDGDEDRIRPNQLFAVSLPHPLVDGEAARGVVRSVDRHLRVRFGVRSLAPEDPRYAGALRGDRVTRDAAYHEGTAWTWLVGAYAEATWRATGDRERALALVREMADHLPEAGLGSISECLDGDAPHAPRACTHQAWGVSETLRILRLLGD
jgi:predicted glycogen debranching enzyme